jgi:acylphosphatase
LSKTSAFDPSNQRLNAIVNGRVQGVGFRFFVLRRAVALGLTGWVRNLSGGTAVEVLAEGDVAGLQELLVALHEGPDAAYVRDVKYHFSPATGEFHNFDVRYR